MLLALSGFGCTRAARPPANAGAPLRVAIMGDMPYHEARAADADAVMAAYRAVLDTIGREDLAFVVHIGDITLRECTDSVYALRHREFMALRHPVVYTYGDNEWTDCDRGRWRQDERLAALRRQFAAGGRSLGQRPIALTRQSETRGFSDYRENVRWIAGGVLFVTLHVTGSNNNRGPDTLSVPTEFAERNAANITWIRESFAVASRSGMSGVAVFMQANPGLTSPGTRYARRPRPDGFAELLDAFQSQAIAFGGAVALIHGDTHYFRVDQPFTDRDGRVIANIIRAETYGTPNLHALIMTVDPRRSNVFVFEPLLVRQNRR